MMRAAAAALALLAAGAARSDTVMVRYQGPVDLARYECLAQPSSFVWRTCYDRGSRRVVANLKGVHYMFCEVSPMTVSAWRSSDSLGRFFNANIKGRYACPPPTK